jgi:predicted  nucleic acid-binding Zn-ribbon protein
MVVPSIALQQLQQQISELQAEKKDSEARLAEAKKKKAFAIEVEDFDEAKAQKELIGQIEYNLFSIEATLDTITKQREEIEKAAAELHASMKATTNSTPTNSAPLERKIIDFQQLAKKKPPPPPPPRSAKPPPPAAGAEAPGKNKKKQKKKNHLN